MNESGLSGLKKPDLSRFAEMTSEISRPSASSSPGLADKVCNRHGYRLNISLGYIDLDDGFGRWGPPHDKQHKKDERKTA